MKKLVIFIMSLTIISKILGFLRELFLSYYYGVSGVSDAYLISITVPTVIFGFVISGVVAGYVPIYNSVEYEKGQKKALIFTNNLISVLIIINFLFITISWIFTEEIIKILASGLEGELLHKTIIFTKISILSILFTGVISVISGYLQINKMQIITAAVGIPLNIIVLVSIAFSAKFSIYILPIGYVLATFVQLIFLLIFAYKKNYRYKPMLNLKDNDLVNIGLMSIPVILGVSVNQINTLVDRTLASQIMVGGISALNYANNLNLFIQGIFVLTIINIYYPIFSKLATEKKYDELRKQIMNTTVITLLCIIPFVFLFIFFSKEIVSILFERGKFDKNAVYHTSNVLIFYSIGMIGFGLRELIVRAFYSIKDSKTPMRNSVITVLINVILNLLLYKKMGISGLAFATSISAIVTTIMLYYQFNKNVINLQFKKMILPIVKMLLISVSLIIFFKLTFEYLQITNIYLTVILFFVYFILYMVLNTLLNKEATFIISDKIHTKMIGEKDEKF